MIAEDSAAAASAHSPLFEQPAAMNRVMREDVLAGRNHLADGRPSAFAEPTRRTGCAPC
jgi:hypothetical protein